MLFVMHWMPCTFFNVSFNLRPVMVDIVRSLSRTSGTLCSRPTQRWVGPRLRAGLIGGAWAFVVAYSRSSAARLSVIYIWFLSGPKYTNLTPHNHTLYRVYGV